MLIGMLGSPFSGKTTLASGIFSELKRNGIPSEYVPEIARGYIMTHRVNFGSKPLEPVDQDAIFMLQKEKELFYKKYNPKAVNITDSCTLNSKYYGVSRVDVYKELNNYDILFFCRTIQIDDSKHDANRLHDLKFSNDMDTQITLELSSYLGSPIIELEGDINNRFSDAFKKIEEKLNEQDF